MKYDTIRKNKLLFPLLLLFSYVYRIITDLRNLFYDFRILKVHYFNKPIISVGNISVGGTGKTPFILYLISQLKNKYDKIAVVSRGYGRKSKGLQIVSDGKGKIISTEIGGDEPVLIANKFKDVIVLVSEDRKKGIKYAIEYFDAELILLDDAFQHRKVDRTCDIVLINSNHHERDRKLLPIGDLREHQNNLDRADIVVLTKINDQTKIKDQITYYNKIKKNIFLSVFKEKYYKNVMSDQIINIDDLSEKDAIGFAGIADSESFKKQLIHSGINLKYFLSFEDHVKYQSNNIEKIIKIAKNHNCKIIVTTEKDFIKLSKGDFNGFDLLIPFMEVNIENEVNFFKKVKDCVD